MKLADISDPLLSMAVLKYAEQHHFTLKEYCADGADFIELTSLIYKCLAQANKNNCAEFAIGQIRNAYNIMEDTHCWKVCIYGFIPKVNALTQNKIA